MIETLRNNLRESYYELTEKVTWPTWPSLVSTTVLVLIASVIFGLLVLVMDIISKNILDLLYSFGG